MKEIKLIYQGGRFQITIPKSIAQGMNWQSGQTLSITIVGNDKLNIMKVNKQ